MTLDFFLSEMSVSDLHGGGITLQRILGDDLADISQFIHPSRFARDFPPTPRILSRSKFVVSRLEERTTQAWLGSRPSSWLLKRRFLRSRHVKRCIELIQSAFPGNGMLRVLVCPQSELSVFILERLKTKRRVRYITWMMDDHVVRHQAGTWLYPSAFHEAFGKHLSEAEGVLVISSELAAFYRQEFGVSSNVLFGPADCVGEPVWTAPTSDSGCRFAYFGSIGPWQSDALLRLARYMGHLDASLDIFTSMQELPIDLQIEGVKLRSPLPGAAVIHEMRNYDAVVLPISFCEPLRHLTEFNIATKMSECLASGTVTVVVAPENAAMVRFLAPRRAACVTAAVDIDEVRVVVSNVKNAKYRRDVLSAARALSLADLSQAVMHGRWQEALIKLARS